VRGRRRRRERGVTCSRVDDEGTFQKMVHLFRYVDIQTRVGVSEDNVVDGVCPQLFFVLGGN
jgi:hypothetical protein